MAIEHSPDGRLVYLHCSSIFSGANSQVRRRKKILQLLRSHESSIKVLTKEFTLKAIAPVAKELLEEEIFESLPRAKLRYPELFQRSETKEAERADSEAEANRIEAEAAQEVVITSDDEGQNECLDFERGEQHIELQRTSKDKKRGEDTVQTSTDGTAIPLISQALQALEIPRLHPVYLPFKIQQKILVLVQSLLEECCLEFGNTWVPDLMLARKWHEAESIELTEWTKRFSKLVDFVPASAIQPIPGKSIAEVLFETSHLRHSAVHRLRTSASGILKMLSAAIAFTEALKDTKRAEHIANIRLQLEASVEEIEQHQNLLELKITDQFEEIARRRAELDELERSSIEEMLKKDEEQRTAAGTALETFLVSSLQFPNSCTCGNPPSSHGAKAETEAEEDKGSSVIGHEETLAVRINEAQAQDEVPCGEEEPDECEDLGHESGSVDVQATSEISVSTLPTSESEWKGQNGRKSAASELVFTPAEEAAEIVDEAPDSGEWYSARTHPPRSRKLGWSRHCRYIISDNVPEEPVDVAEVQPFSREGSHAEQSVIIEDPREDLQTELTIVGFEDPEESPHERHETLHDIEVPIEEPSDPDATPVCIVTWDEADFPEPPSSHADCVLTDIIDFLPRPPSPPWTPSTGAFLHEPAVPEVPADDSHTIAVEILTDTNILRSVVSIRACTRTAVLNEARVYLEKCAEHDHHLGDLMKRGYQLILVSLELYGNDTDLSNCKVEDLSLLIRTIEKTGVPKFTLRISEF